MLFYIVLVRFFCPSYAAWRHPLLAAIASAGVPACVLYHNTLDQPEQGEHRAFREAQAGCENTSVCHPLS